MKQPKYIVHRDTHKLHAINGCGYAKAYNAKKYHEYFTLEEAYSQHGDEIKPCRYCSPNARLDNPNQTA